MSVHFSKYIGFYIAAVLAVIIFMPGSPPLFVDSSKSPKSSVVKASTVATRCPQGQKWTNVVVSKSLNIDKRRLAALKSARSLDNRSICTMPEAKLARAFYRLDQPKTDQPGEWAKFRAMQQSDETGTIKSDGLNIAIKQRMSIVDQNKLAGYARKGGISQGKWESIGPGNIGGRIRTIAIHPDQPEKMWVGSVSGGIWHTVNSGKLWSPVNDFMGNLSITSIVIDPNDYNVMYAATGEGFFNIDAVKGAGVFKTTDGGLSWGQLAATTPEKDLAWEYVNRISIHPFNSNILLAATRGGLFRSENYGDSWEKLVDDYNFHDVKFSPDSGRAIASGRKYNKEAEAMEYRSFYTDDAGERWAMAKEIHEGRIEYAFAPSKPGYVYSSIYNRKEIETSDGDIIALSGEIYRSTDYGRTWTYLASPNHLGNQGWYDNTIWVDPINHQHIIIGGIDLFRSSNEGKNWTQISQWWNKSSIHADHHAIVAHPQYGISNKTIFFGNDGGIYKINNINAYRDNENLNNGLAITQFYGGAGHNGKNGRIFGGTQDNGTVVYTGEKNNWSTLTGGDGGQVAINPADGKYVYGEYQKLQVFRSFDGKNISPMCKGIADSEPRYTNDGEIICGVSDGINKSNFIAPLILDPNDSRYLYAGGASLWRTDGAGSENYQWTSIKSPVRDDWYGYISKITVTKGNMYKIWVGHNNGELYLTRHGREPKPDWYRVGEGQLPKRMILDILVDNKKSNRIYVSFGGYSKDNLYMSADDGQTWQDISGNLPDSPIRTIQQHPNRPDWLYVGTEVGIFTSEDGGLSWTSNNDGPANVAVDQLFWLDKATLVAATHGRGMFKATVADGISSLTAPVLNSPESVISDTNPTYYWKPIDDAESYEIAVTKGDQLLFSKIIAAKDINCDADCGFSTNEVLTAGSYRWRMRTHSGLQVSVWNEKAFKLDPTQKPATATLISPNNTNTTITPVYRWRPANKATYYYLLVVEDALNSGSGGVVFEQWLSAKNAGCDQGGICSVAPSAKLKVGAHRWGIITWNTTGTGNGSDVYNFTARDLVAPEITSPINTISYTNPTYFWKPVVGAEKYDLIVSKADGKWVFRKVISVKDANCSADYCRFFPDKTLVAGSYKTMLRTQGGTQFSAWNKVSFKVDPSLKPGATILISPDGTINTRTPTYKWKAAAKATQYRLWVSDDTFSGESSANVYNNWFTAEALGCKQGGTCSIKPPEKISKGPHRWWVKSWNATGSGDWSKNKNFVISNTAN